MDSVFAGDVVIAILSSSASVTTMRAGVVEVTLFMVAVISTMAGALTASPNTTPV